MNDIEDKSKAKVPSSSGKVARSRAGLSQTVAAAADLLAEGDRAHAGFADDARDLLVGDIAPDPNQPRRHFDPAELQALADDIARRGVLQPILVRPPLQGDDKFRLIAGERRWRAAQMAGKVRIPARVRAMNDEEVRAAQLAENVLRSGLTDIEKGRALRQLYELRKRQDYRTTWEDIAAEVGMGRARIHDLFHLASLPEPVARLIEAGRLSGSHGVALQRAQSYLSEEEVNALAERAARPEPRAGSKRVAGFGLSVTRLRQLIQETLPQDHRALSPYPFGPNAARAGVANRVREASAAKAKAVRPFLKRTLEALKTGTLTPEERQALLSALSDTGGTSQ